VIFKGFSIPTYFIFDADSRYKGKKEEAETETIKRNKRYLRLAGAKEEDFPPTQVSEAWACFEDEMETYLKIELGGDIFNTLRDETAKELGYDKPYSKGIFSGQISSCFRRNNKSNNKTSKEVKKNEQ
jgi:hypothetical protein